nr:outer membrane beta-barrel protein [Burkholderiales bacterium]
MRAGIGWRFNRYFGIEGGYVDIGRMEFTGTDALGTAFTSRAKVRGGQAAVVAFYPFTENFAVFAKLGALVARTQYSDSTGASDSATSVRPYYGLGLQYDFTDALFGRLEYERYANIGSTLSGKTSYSQT